MNKSQYYPDTLHSFFLVLAVIFFQLLSGIIIGIISMSYFDDISLVLVIICSMVSTMLGVYIGIKKSKLSYKSYFRSSNLNWKTPAFLLILLVGTWSVVVGLTSILIDSIPFLKDASSSLNLISNIATTWFGILYIIIIGPIFEETLFRGVILQGLLKNYSIKKAVIVSSLLFGLVHFNLIQSFTTIFIGLVFASVFIKTGSLKMCIIAHMLNNFLSIFLGGLLQNISNTTLIILGLVMAALGFVLVNRCPNNISHIFEVKSNVIIEEENTI